MEQPLQLDANVIIQKLQNQVGQLAGTIAVLEAQLEMMQNPQPEPAPEAPEQPNL